MVSYRAAMWGGGAAPEGVEALKCFGPCEVEHLNRGRSREQGSQE